jgi:general secretion pathway protein C
MSLALAALIAVELARMAVSLLGGSPLKAPEVMPTRGGPTMARPAIDLQTVVSAHLFGVAVAEPVNGDPANAPNSTSNLVLAGTIATQDPKRGVAIISDGGPSKVYAVGDGVGGATLHSVYLDRVLLDRGGSLETLLLPHVLPSRAPPLVQKPAGADPRTLAAVDNIRRMVQQDPGILNEVLRTVASYDNKAGKLRGFRAYPGRNRQAFSRLGLRPGDLVTAINGTPLDDPQRSQEVLNTIQSSDRATVTIERGGEKQDITLNIAQLAEQATKDLETGTGAAPAQGVPGGLGTRGAPVTGPMASPGTGNQNSNE